MARFAGLLGGPLLAWGIMIFILGGTPMGVLFGFLIACLLFVVQLVVTALSSAFGIRGVIGEIITANGLFFGWMYWTCQSAGCPNYSSEMQVLWHSAITGVVCLSYLVRKFVERKLA
ncbi:MAG: hypothetical protein AAGJ70_05890 [Pseudomonadota bacterium]